MDIQNQDAVKALEEATKLSSFELPLNIANAITPVLDITPKFWKNTEEVFQVSTTATGGFSVKNLEAGRGDFYVTYMMFGITKDSANNMASGTIGISGTPKSTNVQVIILPLTVLTTTAQDITREVFFPRPLVLKEGTSIIATGSFTLGTAAISACVGGFYMKTSS